MRSLSLSQAAAFFRQTARFPDLLIKGYGVDTRNIQPGELFFALPGARVDGHAFVAEAQSKGAIAAVVGINFNGDGISMPLIRVNCPFEALQELARKLLSLTPVKVVAITGSLGKTTTKEFLSCLLKGKYKTSASPGNSNSQIGVPLAILNHTTGQEEIVILEMGMTHSGQLDKLLEIAPPDVSVLTTAALVHACNFASLDEIIAAKGRIFSHPKTKMGIVPYELIPFVKGVGTCQKVTFSTEGAGGDYYLENTLLHVPLEGKKIVLDLFQLHGSHNWHNLLAAIAAARCFNLSWEEIQARLPYLQLPEKRLQLIERSEILFLNDSYNAAEASVKAALRTLPPPKEKGKKIAVLGSMMELGKFSEECHRRVGQFALDYLDEVYCFGEECQPIEEIFKKAGKKSALFLDFSDLARTLKKCLQPGDVVLLKGSRSKELWRVLDEF